MVSNTNSLNSKNTKLNLKLYYKKLLEDKLPLIICITGRTMEDEEEDNIWLNRQIPIFKKLGLSNCKTSICVVYSKDLKEIRERSKKNYDEFRKNSIEEINKHLAKVRFEIYHDPKITRRLMASFCSIFFPNIHNDPKKLQPLLLELGFSEDESYRLSKI